MVYAQPDRSRPQSLTYCVFFLSMVHYDQNVMGIALELLQAILAASYSPSRSAILNSQLVSVEIGEVFIGNSSHSFSSPKSIQYPISSDG